MGNRTTLYTSWNSGCPSSFDIYYYSCKIIWLYNETQKETNNRRTEEVAEGKKKSKNALAKTEIQPGTANLWIFDHAMMPLMLGSLEFRIIWFMQVSVGGLSGDDDDDDDNDDDDDVGGGDDGDGDNDDDDSKDRINTNCTKL